MSKGRLEAFTDGVMAILITILVLELRVPEGNTLGALRPLVPVFLTYVLSFVYLAIYWNNHHHMFQLVDRIDGSVLWANLHLLFWLSLFPFATGWMGENHFGALPTSLYGVPLLMAAIAWTILERRLIALQGPGSGLAEALEDGFKEWISLAAYLLAIPLAFVDPRISHGLYVIVALLWLVPDRRVETHLAERRV